MLSILRNYEEDGYKVIEYTNDGVKVTHTIREPLITESPTFEPELTTEELIMAELQWQTQLLEMKGGASE